jgi:outer membrane protein OmpA-like peptidoglycan-associated protein
MAGVTTRQLFRKAIAIGAVIAALFGQGAGAADVEGSSDHPLVGRYEGAEIVGYEVTNYDEATLLEGPFSMVSTDGGAGFTTVEGRIFLIYYALPSGRSALEVLRNYEQSLTSKGFSVVFTCSTAKGSCFETGEDEGGYYLGQAVGDPLVIPKLLDDYVQNWFQGGGRYLLARLDRPEGAVYAAIYLGESGSGTVAVVRVVETTEMETDKIKVVTAAEMETAIAETGKVALYGIHFDFDKDVIKPESKPTLDEIALVLTSDPDLRLRIVGHTDDQGSADYNLDLSERRAASVVAALVADYGIAPERLVAAGAGMTQPVDTNDTEEGRARNRRVELEDLGKDTQQGGETDSAG